jgi:methylmalonyl-CoA mutase N-terminal domain/subunit
MSLAETQRRWLVEHADELGEGEFVSPSGFPVAPVYTPADLEERGWDYERELGFPGQAPFTRGPTPGGYRHELWHLEMYAGFGSAEDANRRFRYLIEHGSTGGVSIALDLPTQIGLDSDDPMARDEVGQIGVALTSLADVERLFDGIPLDRVGHVFTTGNCIGPIAAAWWSAWASTPAPSACRSRTTRSRSTSPAGPSSCRSRRRSGWRPTWSATWSSTCRAGCRSASPART